MANVELAAAYISLIPSLKDFGTTIGKEFTEAVKDVPVEKPAEETSRRWTGAFGKGLAKVGPMAGIALGGALVKGFQGALEGSSALSKVTASMGLSEAESERAGQVAGDLYAKAYGDSLTEVTDAVGTVMSSMSSMRGASAADLQAITGQAMDMARVFDVDLAEAANTAGIMISKGLASDSAEAMDLLVASMQQVPEHVRGEVLAAMTEYSGYFAQLGIEGDQAMGLIVAASESGTIGVDKMGDAIKEFTIRSTDMSTATSDAYAAIGVDMDEMTNALLAGGDQGAAAMGQIVDGLLNIKDPGEQAAAAIALFGTPLEDLGTDQIPTFLQSLATGSQGLGDFGGAAQQLSDTVNSGPGVAMQQFARSMEQLATTAVSYLMPAIQPVADWFLANEWAFGAVAAVIGGVLVAAFMAWTGSIIAANVALLANPVTWIVLGIVALIAALVALIANWDSVSSWLSSVWRATVDGVVAAWEWMKSTTSNVMSAIGSAITSGWNAIKSTFSASWNAIKSATSAAWNAIKSAFSSGWNALKSGATAAWNALKAAFSSGINTAVSLVRGLPGKARSALSSLTSTLRSIATSAWNGLKSAFTTGIGAAVSLARSLPGKVVGALGNLGSRLVASGRSLISGFTQGIKDGIGKAISAVKDGVQRIRNFFPFSPAKEGPFSGRGYTTYSGRALMGDFAKAVRSEEGTVRAAIDSALDYQPQAFDVPAFGAGGAPSTTSPTLVRLELVDERMRGLIRAEVRQMQREGLVYA